MYGTNISSLLMVAFALVACEAPVEVGKDDMGRAYASELEQWGQLQTFAVGTWATNVPRVVLQRDAPQPRSPYQLLDLPKVNTLLLGAHNGDSTASQLYNLRWEMKLGVGGARVPVRFDAVGATRIAVPTEGFTLSLVVESFPAPYAQGDLPAGIVDAFAYSAEGGVGHSYAEGATHTTQWELTTTAGAALFDIPIPVGATAFRIVGKSSTGGGIATPFRSALLVQMMQGATILGTLVGEGAAPADPSLRTLYYSGLWFPLPGSITKFQVAITDFPVVTRLGVQFKIDI